MELRQRLGEARRTVRQETDERVRMARLRVCRDVLVAVAVVAVVLTVLGAVAPMPVQAPRSWTSLIFPFQLYLGGAVAWLSVWRRGASTRELQRARNARLVLALPAAPAAVFGLVYLLSQDLTHAIRAAIIATVGVAAAALVGYIRWARGV